MWRSRCRIWCMRRVVREFVVAVESEAAIHLRYYFGFEQGEANPSIWRCVEAIV